MSIINLPMLQQAGYQSNPSMGPPNYRQADDLARSCSNCTRFKDGFCDKYATKVDDTFVCDAFQPANDETGPLADVTKQIGSIGSMGPSEGPTDEKEASQKLTPRQAFKAAFYMKCLEEGLTADEIHSRAVFGAKLVKQALDPFYLGAPLAWLASGAGRAALAAGVAIPMGLGAAGGYSAAKLTSDVDKDIENVKDQEILDTYSHLADDAERKAKIKRKLMGLSANQPLLALKTNKGDQPIQPMA
jgi:hypothetical protein